MAETIVRGPFIGLGSLLNSPNPNGSIPADEPTDGPALNYQGFAFADPRFFPANKDSLSIGRIPGFICNGDIQLVNAQPSASTATPVDIAALQATTNGTPMTLVTTQASVANTGQCQHMPSAPLIPFGGTLTSAFALDMGFAYGTTVAASGTVTVVDSSVFELGQWICIGGAGNSGTTKPLMTQVTNPSLSSTTISVFPVPLGSVTRAPISNGNAYVGFPANVTATAVSPYEQGGVGRFFNPPEGVARVVGINAAAGAAGGIFTVAGYDIYGYAMTEAITVGAGAVVAYGNKCFKYITSVTPNVTDASAHYSVGVGDVIGFNLRSNNFELLRIFVAGALCVVTGWKAGLIAPNGPSTSTTADVRGSIQIGTRGNNTGSGAAGATGGPLSGTIRVTVLKSVSIKSLLLASPNNSNSLFGLPQA